MEEVEEFESLDESELTAVTPVPVASRAAGSSPAPSRTSVPPPIPKHALERSSQVGLRTSPGIRSSLPAAPPPAGTVGNAPSSGIYRIETSAAAGNSTSSTSLANASLASTEKRAQSSAPITLDKLELERWKALVHELELKVRLRDDLIAELKRTLEEQRRLTAATEQHSKRIEAQLHALQSVPAPAKRDDLKRIKGIGPAFERKLHALGVTSFAEVAAFGEADVERIATALAILPQRIMRDGWIEAAKQLTAEALAEG